MLANVGEVLDRWTMLRAFSWCRTGPWTLGIIHLRHMVKAGLDLFRLIFPHWGVGFRGGRNGRNSLTVAALTEVAQPPLVGFS